MVRNADRHRSRLFAWTAVLAAGLFAGSCANAPEAWREELLVFGTRATIEIRGTPKANATGATAEIAEIFARYHADWHAWQPSALTRLNAAFAAGEVADAPASIRRSIARAKDLTSRSEGLVDPGVGGLVALWGFHTSDYPITSPAPSDVQIDAWRAAAPSVNDLHIDGGRVWSDNSAVQLDLGAIAEGLAAEVALARLRAHGVDQALLNLGGDVVAIGSAGDRPWRVGVRDPFGDALGSIELHDGEALFASGSYHKFRLDAVGRRWPHILDPRTGRPARGIATAVVLHSDPVLADAAATALFIGGFARFPELLDSLGIHCALLLSEDDEVWQTDAMQARLTFVRAPRSARQPIDRGPDCNTR
jgi:FAD:protein FMN transferase